MIHINITSVNKRRGINTLIFVLIAIVFGIGLIAPLLSKIAVSYIRWVAGVLGVSLHEDFSAWLEYYAQFFATSISALTAYLLIYSEIRQNRTSKRIDCIIEDSSNIQYSKALISACKSNYQASLKGYNTALKDEAKQRQEDRFSLEMLKDKSGNNANKAVRVIRKVSIIWKGMEPSAQDYSKIRIRTNPALEMLLIEFINSAIEAMSYLGRKYDYPTEGLFDNLDWFYTYIENDGITKRIAMADHLISNLDKQLSENNKQLSDFGIIGPHNNKAT